MRIAIFYFTFFGAIGVLLPYLPPYLRTLGLDGKQIAAVISLPSFLAIGVPLLWGFAADRTRRPVILLRIAAAGTALAFAPMLLARDFAAAVAIMAAYGVFQSTLTPLADSVAVVEARRLGTDYSRLRLWGSVGFVLTTWGFGRWLAGPGHPYDAVVLTTTLFAATAVSSWAVPRGAPPPVVPAVRDALRLAARPELLLFLLAAMMHWAALGPFHVLFAIHFQDLQVPPHWIGTALALAVTAEVGVMAAFRSLHRRLPVPAILAAAFAASALRWALTAMLGAGLPLTAVQLLHGMTFGAFYVGSILHLEALVPGPLRATGRALFGSVVFGLGGVGGNLLAGTLYDLGGGRLSFGAAAGLELLAPVLLWAALAAGRRAAAGRASRPELG